MAAMLPMTKNHLRADLRRAAHAGRHGDTLIAHLDPREAAMLRAMGGAGTRNPKTGLLEFYGREGGGLGPGTNGPGSAHDDSRTSGGAGPDGRHGATPSGNISTRDLLSGGWNAPAQGGPTITRGNPPSTPRPGTGDRWGFYRDPNVETPEVAQAHQNYNKATDALQDRSFGTWATDRLKDMIPGVSQAIPDWSHPQTYANGTYHDTWSPIAAAAGVLGGLAVPGGGVLAEPLAQKASDLLQGPQYTFGGGGWGATTSPTNHDLGPDGLTDKERGGAYGGGPANTAQGPGGATAGPGHSVGGGGGSNPGLGSGSLLPPIAGNGGQVTAPPIPGSGSIPGAPLPPVNVAQQQSPGMYNPIAGPSPYGWTLPPWAYQGVRA